MNIFLPDYAVECLNKIESVGFEAWAVGGCVRDALLGIDVGDIDIASSASPEDIKGIFSKVYDTGIKHGTVTVLIDGHQIEITRFRNDGDYSDGRHPDSVTPALSISEDLARRDFTINAMAYNPKRGFLDLYGGLSDLNLGIIRCVGDPQKRFNEDALRIMRAFRFASKLGFSIDNESYNAAISLSGRLLLVSRERISRELYLILRGKNPDVASDLINSGALEHIGVYHVKNNINAISAVPADEGCVFASLAYLCESDAGVICSNLKTSRKTREDAVCYFSEMSLPLPQSSYELKKRIRVLGVRYPLYLRMRSVLLDEDTTDLMSLYSHIISSGEPYDIHMLAINGSDLNKNGISGPKTGQKLELLLDAVMADPKLNTRENLLSLL